MRKLDSARPQKSVAMYILDNEPTLWNQTHRDVHPDPVTLRRAARTHDRATATEIRQADPDAVIAGPALWGWPAYLLRADDETRRSIRHPDRKTHGDVPLLAAGGLAHSRTRGADRRSHPRRGRRALLSAGARASASAKTGATDPDTPARRIRCTRALWDPHYADESWIKTGPADPAAAGLDRRELPWAGHLDRRVELRRRGPHERRPRGGRGARAASGAGASPRPFTGRKFPNNSPGFYAFRAYRNFHGKGARFLDLSVPARGADQVSIFASRDESGTHLVAIALNLDPAVAAEAELDAVRAAGTPPAAARSSMVRGGRASPSRTRIMRTKRCSTRSSRPTRSRSSS